MREILFRGKRADGGGWVEGFFVYCKSAYDDSETDRVAEIIPFDADRIYTGEYCSSDVCVVNFETVGQFTGLTDKNGKKIFEGDIVHLTDVRYDNEWKAVVVFGNPYCEYSWGWNFDYIGEKPQVNTDILLWVEMEELQVYCEIIGNIYDNPELLKGA